MLQLQWVGGQLFKAIANYHKKTNKNINNYENFFFERNLLTDNINFDLLKVGKFHFSACWHSYRAE